MPKEYKKFYQMDIWEDAFELQKEIFDLSSKFPPEEKYGLGNQINKSTNSVLANIAESHGRFHYADKVRVLYIVRGEIEETQSHIIIAQSRGYISKEKTQQLISKYEKVKMKLNGYIADFSWKNEN